MKHLLLFLLILFCCKLSYAADIYVTPNRPADVGNGSLNSPYRDLSAAMQTAQPGDTIKLMAGVHGTDWSENECTTHCSGVITTWTSGTDQNPITITSYPNPLDAVIDGHGEEASCVYVGHQNYVIDGIELKNCGYFGIQADGDTYGTYDANSASGNWGGYGTRHYNNNGINNLIIRNNYIHDCQLDAVKTTHGDNITVENNNMHNVSKIPSGHSIMQMNGIYGGVVRNNWMHDDLPIVSPHILFFMKGGSKDIIVENNLFENGGTGWAGIEIGDNMEWYNIRYTPSEIPTLNSRILAEIDGDNEIMPTSGGVYANSTTYQPEVLAEARNITVRGNILKNIDVPFSSRNGYNVKWYNNTAINSGQSSGWYKLWTDGYNGIAGLGYASHAHVCKNQKFYNNLFYNDSVAVQNLGVAGRAYYVKDKDGENYPLLNQEGLEMDYNQYYNMGYTWFSPNISTSVDTHSLFNSNPSFDSTYHPTSSNPASNAGANLRSLGILSENETWVDRDGVTRPTAAEVANGYNIGALLTGSADTGIPGICGSFNGLALSSAPSTGLCSTGTPSAVSGTGPWAWTCAGSGGGSTANCGATKTKVISSKVARVKYGSNGKITGSLK